MDNQENLVHKTQDEGKQIKIKTQFVLDTTMRKHT